MSRLDQRLAALSPEQRAQLALRLKRKADDGAKLSSSERIAVSPESRFEPFPLTDLQRAVWLGRTDTFAVGEIASRVYLQLEVPGLDVSRMEQAWNALVRRHDMLRLVVGNDGRQRVLQEVPDYHFAVHDLRAMADTERAERLDAVHEAMFRSLRDASEWPLFDIQVSLLPDGIGRVHVVQDALNVDGGSAGILFREWAQLYKDPDSELPALDLTFRDYVIHEREREASAEFERAKKYWMDRLGDFPLAPDLPLARSPGAVGAPRFRREAITLDRDVSARLRRVATRMGVSPTALFVCAYAEILTRWSGSPRFAINIPLYNRPSEHPRINDVVGPFSTIELLAIDNSVVESFATRARRIQRQLLEDLDHRQFDGVRLARELVRARGVESGWAPVVFTSLLDHHFSESASGVGTIVRSLNQTAQVWMDLHVDELHGEFLLKWDTVEGLFPNGMAEDMLGAMRRLLDGVATGEVDKPSAGVSLIPPEHAERRAAVNRTAAPYPNGLAHHAIEQQAKDRPDHVAVVNGAKRLTFRELDELANRIARTVRRHGVQPDELVTVAMEKGWEQIAAVLGILKAGAAYVPVDVESPAERLRYLIEHAEARLVLTQKRLEGTLDWPGGMARLSVDRDESWDDDDTPIASVQRPHSLAYVLYTSGSTGAPKGVMIEHRSLVNRMTDSIARLRITHADRVIAITALHHDLSVFDIFGGLAAGATLIIPEHAQRRDPGHWSDLVASERVTTWNSVPAFVEMMVEYVEGRPSAQELDLGSLRRVIMGGDWIPVSLPDRIRRLAPNAEVISSGGPTETTVWDIWYSMGRVDPAWRSIPYGRPLTNATYWVLDDNGEERPDWVPGELYIGGVGLARGYWRDDEKTAEKFVHHPRLGERLYRSGDRGRWLPDGTIEILGRTDFQVKIQGQRIELGEIEGVLVMHPRVRSAVVAAIGETGAKRRLVGYVVPIDGAQLSDKDLREHVAHHLPPHMVPRLWVRLERLPLSANGKVDRRALPLPDEPQALTETAQPASAGVAAGLETKLTAIVADVLRVDTVDPEESVLNYGANSLDLVRLGNRLEQELGTRPRIDALFRLETVRELADWYGVNFETLAPVDHPAIAALSDIPAGITATSGAPHRIEPLQQSGPCVPSLVQEQLWLLNQLAPGSPVYNIVDAIAISGPYDADAMRRAISEIARRHGVLRTAFSHQDGQLLQIVAPTIDASLPERDLSFLPETERESAWVAIAGEEGRTPFDLSRAPLFRATVVHFSDQDHRLLLTIHHIIADEWSMELLQGEVTQLYGEFSRGLPSPLPELPIQYTDFARWQREWLQGEVLEERMAFWKGELASAPSILELPTDKPRPAVQSFLGATESFELSKTLFERLNAVAREEGATLFMVLEAAFATLLHRYTGQDDLLVGIPISVRTHAETRDLIGCFLNTIVLRSQFPDGLTFRALLQQTRERALGSYQHSDLPFEHLVTASAPERDPSRTPLFQVMFALHDPGAASQFLRMWRHREFDTGTSKFDLTLLVGESEQGLWGLVEYSTDLFEAESVQRLCQHYGTLLEAIATNPDERISRLSMLSEAERRQILVEWNDTAELPLPPVLPEWIEAQVRRTPDDVAVVFEQESLTYGELDRRATRLAHALRRLGVGADVLVGVLVERSLDMVAALIGIMKAGGAYLPLDPSFPRERLAYMVDDSGMRVLVTHRGLDQAVGVRSPSVVYLDDDQQDAGEQGVDASSLPPCSPEQLVHVLYTSGSTGKPKGVAIPHSALVNLLRVVQRNLVFGPNDTLLAISTLSFDLTGLEVFVPLVSGGKVVIARREDVIDPERLAQRISDSGCTVMQATPTTWRALVNAGWKGVPHLQIITGGEPLPADLAHALLVRCGKLWNMYGPTETTIYCTHLLVTTPPTGITSIGRPMANTQIYPLDARQNLLPVGVPGELYIGGVCLAREYLHREELTRERFVPNPFAPGRRLYRSGDVGRWLADGRLEWIARADFQVKVRGFRIEPGEIEAAIARHPAVREVVVVAREDLSGEKGLVAYVVGPDAPTDLIDELRALIRAELPDYMMPARFVILEALPRTANGKVDRKALPAPSAEDRAVAGLAVPPRTPTEATVMQVFHNVIERSDFGVFESFFDLGGHSLMAARLMAQLRSVAGVILPLRTLFERPTVAALAEAIDAQSGAAGQAPAEAERIEPRERSGPCPPSFVQEQLWFLDQLAPGSPVYNIVDVIPISGVYHADAMQKTMAELVRRHEVLRTAFSQQDGELVQVIAPAIEPVVPECDLSELPEDERDLEWGRLTRSEGRRAFDLSRAPLFRTAVVHVSPLEHRLLVVIHHIIADEWSMELLHQEVNQLYSAFAQGRPSPLPELPIQYADFASWQHRWLKGDVLEKQMAFWREALAGAPSTLELPTDKPRPPVQSFRGATESIELPPGVLESLKALARAEQATLFMVLEAAFVTLLHRYTGQDDILVGTPISGRARSETQRLIGCFLNTIVLRSQFAEGGSFRALLKETRERASSAYSHADLPFEHLVAAMAPERDASRTPLFQVMFVLHNPDALSQASKVSGHLELETGTSKFDLTLSVAETEGGLEGLIEYSTDLFEGDTIRRLGQHYGQLLKAIATNPDESVSLLPMLTEAERRQLLVGWNDTAATPANALSLHQLIEERARRTPDQIAIAFEQERLTYGELDCRADRLAHQLRRLGVGPDQLVGVLVERSADMVVALLGILKAGGAYVPLDPAFPPERLAYMVEDSRMRGLVTHGKLDEILPIRPQLIARVDRDRGQFAPEGVDRAPEAVSTPDQLAYVLYTSGSTGEPKGVAIPHAALTNFVLSMQHEPGFAATDTLLAVTTLSFDIAGLELYLPLVSGGRVVIASREDTIDPKRLIEQIRDSACTVMQATPSTWRALIDAGWSGTPQLRILCGGEALPSDLAAALLPRCAELWNMYGPTETTIWSTIQRITTVTRQVPIGRPIANTQAYVLDANQNVLPIGVPGELHIGGTGLARGYLHRDALTRERFIPNPFAPNARLYRTGDLARWHADGSLEWIARLDQQVKVRGFRIELGEIETVIGRHPAVREAVVAVREDTSREKQLIAYVVAPDAPADLIDQLRALIRTTLPEYMMPARFVSLEALPRTANGKVDRKALPAPSAEDATVLAAAVPPRTATEEKVLELFRTVVGRTDFGVFESFFDLGGHSLMAARLMGQLRSIAGVDLPLRTLFERPTVADLAEAVDAVSWARSQARTDHTGDREEIAL